MKGRRKTGDEGGGGDDGGRVSANADELRRGLEALTGQSEFRPGQREILEILLAQRSVLGLLPTGGGKSLCFQLPARLDLGPVLVISPLLALMQDQVERARGLGLRAARIEAAQGPAAAAVSVAAWQAGELELLFVSPERCARADFRAVLRRKRPGLIAIDEAHCLSEWGHHFRPDYLGLGGFCALLQAPVLALTATATPRVVAEIRDAFGIAAAAVVRAPLARANLGFVVRPAAGEAKAQTLVEGLCRPDALPAVVYAMRQESTEGVAALLRREGIEARAYHAGLRREAREAVQRDFLTGELPVVVATIAFGMGIDKAELRSVWHWHLPSSLEALAQQAGRAGRDGLPARSVVLADATDRVPLRNFAHGERPAPGALRQLAETLLGGAGEVELSARDAARALDMRVESIETVLALLQQRGRIEPFGSHFAGTRFHFVRDRDHALAGLERGRRALAAAAFDRATATRWGWRLDWAEAAVALECEEEELLELFTGLGQAGDLRLRPTGLRLRFRRGPQGGRPAEVARELDEHFGRIEAGQLERVDQVLAWCVSTRCLAQSLERHFAAGDPEEGKPGCGHCSVCLGDDRIELPDATPRDLSLEQADLVRELALEHHPALRQPRQLARMLAGIPSPASRAAGLNRDGRWGALASVPFELLLVYAREVLPGREQW